MATCSAFYGLSAGAPPPRPQFDLPTNAFAFFFYQLGRCAGGVVLPGMPASPVSCMWVPVTGQWTMAADFENQRMRLVQSDPLVFIGGYAWDGQTMRWLQTSA